MLKSFGKEKQRILKKVSDTLFDCTEDDDDYYEKLVWVLEWTYSSIAHPAIDVSSEDEKKKHIFDMLRDLINDCEDDFQAKTWILTWVSNEIAVYGVPVILSWGSGDD